MTHQLREDITYDAIIVGGGLAGLTTAYMLRDKNILVLEKEARFGGRVLSEQVDGLTNNIGTQYAHRINFCRSFKTRAREPGVYAFLQANALFVCNLR